MTEEGAESTIEKKLVTIYTDGACSLNPFMGGYAVRERAFSTTPVICGEVKPAKRGPVELRRVAALPKGRLKTRCAHSECYYEA